MTANPLIAGVGISGIAVSILIGKAADKLFEKSMSDYPPAIYGRGDDCLLVEDNSQTSGHAIRTDDGFLSMVDSDGRLV